MCIAGSSLEYTEVGSLITRKDTPKLLRVSCVEGL